MRKSAKERKISKVDDELKVGSFIKIILGILIVLVIFSLITMFITRDKTPNEGEDNTIQYTKIIVGSILNRSEEKYYVLVEKKDDLNLSTYESSINIYNSASGHLRFYTVDLDDTFNANYVSTESHLDIDNITDIRFSETTLLYIVNGHISEYITGDNIGTYLNNLSA